MLRQYHPSALEKPLIQQFFAYKVFFRRTGMGKTKNAVISPHFIGELIFFFILFKGFRAFIGSQQNEQSSEDQLYIKPHAVFVYIGQVEY